MPTSTTATTTSSVLSKLGTVAIIIVSGYVLTKAITGKART
jgi:hypothetical protein